MKREDITALFPDIEKEKLDKIMGLNGADVNAAKAEAEALRGQLSAAQARITELESKTADNGSAAKIAELTAELEAILAEPVQQTRKRRLEAYQDKLASLEFLDIKTPTLIQFNDSTAAYLQAG